MKYYIIVIILFIFSLNVMCNEEDSGNNEENKENQIVNEGENKENNMEEIIKERVEEELKRYRPSNISELFTEVLNKEQKLKAISKNLDIKKQQLEKGEKSLQKQIEKFHQEQNNFIGCVDKNNREKSDRINHIVSIISNMRPAKASDVLSVQEEEVAVKVISKLEPLKASKIFNLMDKEISARIQKQYLYMKK